MVTPDFLDKVRPLIDETIRKLAKTKFRADPIGGVKYSRATSIISSAYKRHGQILGVSMLECLKLNSQLTAWSEGEFKLSGESLTKIQEFQRIEPFLRVKLRYGDRERTTPLDVVVYNSATMTLRAYNVKRGNGAYDAGKKRLIIEDLLRANMLLADYGAQLGLPVQTAEAKVIFYYGLRSVPPPLSLIADELDQHFDYPVCEHVEIANDYFRIKLYELIEAWEGV